MASRASTIAPALALLPLLASCQGAGSRPDSMDSDTFASASASAGTVTATDTSPGSESGDGDGDSGDGDGDGDTTTGDGDGDPTTGDGDGDTGEQGLPPELLSSSPAAGELGVDPNTPVELVFAAALDPSTLATNAGTNACTGALQLSNDGFVTCVPLLGQVESDGDTQFTFSPDGPLDSLSAYEMRLASTVASAGGVELGVDTLITEEPFETRYFHTIAIDGSNDFDEASESFSTTSEGFTAYVAWDADYVYLGFEGPDVGANAADTFVLAYLGGSPGIVSGVDYQGQAPQLPFAARWHPRWKTDGSYTNMQEFDGQWADAAVPLLGPADYDHAGQFVEMRLARDLLGAPETLPLVMGILREGNNPASFAGMPAGTYTDGFDPDFEVYFDFELDGSTLPINHVLQ